MKKHLPAIFAVLAVTLLGMGHYWGLFIAPREREMGDVYRIIFAHVPCAWLALVSFTVVFFASLSYLLRSNMKADAVAEASAEIGVLLTALLLVTGSLWGRPTWGVWWTWDPRLTTAAIMFFAFAGYLALRRFIDGPERRATWAAVVAIVIYIDIPIVWFSVKWWNTLHQLQSTPQTVDASMVTPLRISAFGMLFTYLALLLFRMRLAERRRQAELSEPPPPLQAPQEVSP